MLTHYILLSILLAAAQINAREVCFDDLGCFVDTKPFSGSTQRPVAVLPDTPQKINTSFILYTSRNTPGEFITYSNIPASFNVSLPTKLLVHGFWHDAQRPWVLDMKDALLNASRMNVIAVDWSGGNKLPYTQATANTQVVGAEIARLIKSVCEKSGAKAADFHIIGHSLGAHIAGYTGQRLDGQLGKITGLDPAGPYFEYTEPIVSLDKTDAKFVEVIHTDGSARLALGLGIIQPVGHVDFYPNGGRNQPKCPQVTGKLLTGFLDALTLDLESIEENFSCSHTAALYYYIESVKKSCEFVAYPCKSLENFASGKCLACGDKGCNRMGFFTSESKDLGSLYLDTQSPEADSYCKQNWGVTLDSNSVDNLSRTVGSFKVFFETVSGSVSSTEILDDYNTIFKVNSVESRLVSLDSPIREAIGALYVSFTKTGNFLTSWMYDNSWSFRPISVFNADKQTSEQFCSQETVIQTGKTVKFVKC